ncbi:helix-turn-helix transcriptional regulator [Ferruginibacter paludis]|uniref:helix-turn-helix domain-containing protein n=1 Tax=Ferruginibacter paludis TaxID=1310417 RepID=UPI0025B5EE81|nr:helix-turn-helix transcriptional regulator [Ferruginibacter paludis]MDN3656693.1 helix-turn-helix transcriptional regulator [Ferruginibacter paludis]
MNKPTRQISAAIQQLQKSRSATAFEKTKKQLMLAAKIQDAIKEKGLNNSRFAQQMDQHPSVISKWLSGTHNFTTDTLFDIEAVLGIKLVMITEPKPEVIVKEYLAVVMGGSTVRYDHLHYSGKTTIGMSKNIRITATPLAPHHKLTLPIFN